MFSFKSLLVVHLATNIWLTNAHSHTSSNPNIILTLKNPLEPIYQQIAAQSFLSKAAKTQSLVKAMKDATAKWQAPVFVALKPFKVEVEGYWITNQIRVKNADSHVLAAMRALEMVEDIEEEKLIPLRPFLNPIIAERPPKEATWSVKKIGAPFVWGKSMGKGIKVGIVSAGVRLTHVALESNYVGADENGWYDPIYNTTVPEDPTGGGTHAAGICCGNNGIGVAPLSKWLGCKACDEHGSCTSGDLIACGQFMTCPTNPQGLEADCSKAPDVVLSTWSHNTGNSTFYNGVIKMWNAAGIIPFFGCTNGPRCGSALSPADQPGVISVGSTNSSDVVSTFSCRGPKRVPDGNVSPLIVAPGEGIYSASYLGDNAYEYRSGASRAMCAAGGAAALLLAENPNLTLQQIEKLLFESANKNLGATGSFCGGIPETTYPNDVAGNGRLDVYEAFIKLLFEDAKKSV